jgi:tetratricopeptide (TPR) repeat protein
MWVYVWIGNRIPEARSWLLDFPKPTPGLERLREGHYWWLLGGTGYEMGEYESSRLAIENAIPILEESGDEEVLAWAHFISGLLLPAFGANPQLVMATLDDALRRFRQTGDRWGEGYALIGYGILAAASGDFATAEDYHLQCRTLGEALCNDVLIGHAETQLGFTYLASGQGNRAREALQRAVDQFRPLRYREGICYALEALAALSFGEDRTELGMIALGAAEGVRSKIGLRPWPAVMWFFDMLSAMADGFEDPRLQAARLAGRRMSPFDAVDLVLGAAVEVGAGASS